MRASRGVSRVVGSLLVVLFPAAAPAQPAPAAPPSAADLAPPNAGRARGGDITRDDYIARAVERAKHAAEKRFDKMDADHNGVLTADERRAARAERRQQRNPESQ
jgi:hypothetical protein